MKYKENQLTKSRHEYENSLANAPLKKKIGFFSAILVVIGSCIGSGIFFKSQAVLTNSQGSIIFAMFTWLFAAFGIICMALAIIDISSSRNDNLSVIGWCKTFNSRLIYKSCKNFVFLIYSPIKYFIMPLYCVMAFQDGIAAIYIQSGKPYNGFNTNVDWLIVMFIVFAMSTYFILVCGLSAKIANIQNWIISCFKFFPLVFAAIIGFVIVGIEGHISGPNYGIGFKPEADLNLNFQFNLLSPWFGLFIASIGIFYAYDGFYNVAGIKSELKEPRKTPVILLFGLIATTVIYLVIALSMSLGSTRGNPQGLVFFFAKHNILPLFAVFQILIGIGIFSVLNGFALYSPRYVEDLAMDGELPYSDLIVKKFKNKTKFIGIIYNLITSWLIILVFSIIGGLAYINNYDQSGVVFANVNQLKPVLGDNVNALFNGYIVNDNVVYYYGSGVGKLYTFCDLVSGWTALIMFMFIITSIYGGLKNQKTKKINIKYNKFFKPFAIIAIIVISLCGIVTLFEQFANLFLIYKLNKNDPSFNDIIIARIMNIVVLLLYICIIFLPTIIQNKIDKQKYGSAQNGDVARVNVIRKIMGYDLVTSYEELVNETKIGTIGNTLTNEVLEI